MYHPRLRSVKNAQNNPQSFSVDDFYPRGRFVECQSPQQELFDTEYELKKAGYTADEVEDALTFQRLKNDIIASKDKWMSTPRLEP
ncbi:MAG: hypothetical protein QOE77_1951 [Blastocatellia bacterium]|jgi:hypothetical protein|nr:hypothetical protein [Blastocatellia bacterium]